MPTLWLTTVVLRGMPAQSRRFLPNLDIDLAMTDTLSLIRPDDWHVHLRDGDLLASVVPATARQFARAIVMPNLQSPITTTQMALAYRDRILAACPAESTFEPLMTLYLTDMTTAEEIGRARAAGVVACKLYPAGATTNSAAGVTDISRLYPVLEAMATEGLLLLVHGEVTEHATDIFDREKAFIDKVMMPVRQRFPELKIVFEHITTADAVDFVKDCPDRLGATITPQHLLFNRNDMLVGGIRPHFFCLPILKRRSHQEALVTAATSGDPRFFLGTDSAPHARHLKESACGCAGCYSAWSALELYAEAFERAGALDRLEGFASFFGPDFYGLPRNRERVTLKREPWQLPAVLPLGESEIVPLGAGITLNWKLADSPA